MMNIDKIDDGNLYDIDEIIELLSINDKPGMELLFKKAYEIKKKYTGTTVYFRGLIELSNICEKNCYYCGIRKANHNIERYMMDASEILKEAKHAWQWGYGSIVLQAGEMSNSNYIAFIENIIKEIKKLSNDELGITLSLGEQDEDTYKRWYDAGAHRYLLRIETSDTDLYCKLHPEDHSFKKRLECLEILKNTGYYLGTGTMIGLPGQTLRHLARDILFFRDIDADMIGMGPYIPHQDTPAGECITDFQSIKQDQLDLSLRMIAVTRIILKDVNIASTTALQAIDDSGREMGLLAGANIIMPNLTDTVYRRGYQLYDNKPCLDENAVYCRVCLESRIESIGESIGFNKWGDSPHYKKRIPAGNF